MKFVKYLTAMALAALTLLSGANTNIASDTDNVKFRELIFSDELYSQKIVDSNEMTLEEMYDLYNGTLITDEEAVKIVAKHTREDVTSYKRIKKGTIVKDNVKFVKAVTDRGEANWGGYIVESSKITEASGRFTVISNPPANAFSGPALGAFVGIGGVNSGSLIQSGVSFYHKKAFIEMLPADPMYVFNVNTGDIIHASVSWDVDYRQWACIVMNMSTSNYYLGLYTYNADRTTAEWVIENARNSAINKIERINFTNCFWTNDIGTGYPGNTQNINSDSSKVLYRVKIFGTNYPSAINSDGRSFSMSYN